MSSHPDIVRLIAELRPCSFARACALSLEILDEVELGEVTAWAIPASGRRRKRGLADYLAELEAGSTKPKRADGLWWLGDEDQLAIREAWAREGFELELDLVTEGGARRPAEALRAHLRLCRALLERDAVVGARVDWVGAGAMCLPELPLAGVRNLLVVVSDAQIDEVYDDPDAFFAGWARREDFGALRLLVRGESADDGAALLEAILASHWAMARATKPGGVGFALPQVEDDERAIYRAGEPRLSMVGYDADEREIELTCTPGPGEHVQGWELFDLWHPIAQGELPDGRELVGARVVFLDADAAEREKRPLLDLGARVFVQDERGDVEIGPD